MCNIRRFFLIARAVRGRFPQTRDLWKRGDMGSRVGHVSAYGISRWSRSPGCCGFRGVFRVRRISFFFVFFFERTRPAASMRPPCLIYFSTSNTGLKCEGGQLWDHTFYTGFNVWGVSYMKSIFDHNVRSPTDLVL